MSPLYITIVMSWMWMIKTDKRLGNFQIQEVGLFNFDNNSNNKKAKKHPQSQETTLPQPKIILKNRNLQNLNLRKFHLKCRKILHILDGDSISLHLYENNWTIQCELNRATCSLLTSLVHGSEAEHFGLALGIPQAHPFASIILINTAILHAPPHPLKRNANEWDL